MSERFNSGIGGYTCDNCLVLLWAGVGGAKTPENRRYIYSTKKEDIVKVRKDWFCSKDCVECFSRKVKVYE